MKRTFVLILTIAAFSACLNPGAYLVEQSCDATNTPRPTYTPRPTLTCLPLATGTPYPTATAYPTQVPIVTVTVTPTNTPTVTPTVTPTATPPPAPDTARYVSTVGIDTGDCDDIDASCRTWRYASTRVQPGETVYFAPGWYSRVFGGSAWTEITFAGEPGRPITIAPLPGAPGVVEFARALEIRGQYGVIVGIDLASTGAYSVLSIYGAKFVTFENNTIHGALEQDCVHIHRDSDYVTFVENEVYDCGQALSSYSGPGDGIDTTGATNLVYRNNIIHDAWRGIQIKGGARDVLIEGNTIYNTGDPIFGTSISSLRNDPANPEHGNLEMHDPAVAIEDRYQAKNVVVRGNTIRDVSGFAVFGPRGWRDWEFSGNTITHPSSMRLLYTDSASWEFFDSTAIEYCQPNACEACTTYSGPLDCVKIYLPTGPGVMRDNDVTEE